MRKAANGKQRGGAVGALSVDVKGLGFDKNGFYDISVPSPTRHHSSVRGEDEGARGHPQHVKSTTTLSTPSADTGMAFAS